MTTESTRPAPSSPSGFTALETLTVTPEAGVTLTVRVAPAADPTAPVVLVLPAMAMKAKFYFPLLTALRAAGLSAASVDLRGQGEARPALDPASRFGYRELVETDLPAVVDAVAARFPGAPLHLFGHSLGGQLAVLHTARCPDTVRGVVLIGTGSVWWRAFGPRWFEALWKIQTIGVRSWWAGHWPGGMLIGGPMAGRVMTDWARHSRTGRYRPAGSSVRYDDLVAALERPLLVISLDEDPLGPRSTVDHLCRRLRSAAITRLHLDASSDVRHRDHFAWVKDSDVLGPTVAAWIAGDHRLPDGAARRAR
ncbi:alpha/beta hydrolase family protein [Actinomycetospora chiangmaiensis]|uniref:alpha/beta hydrolase family protein n=1 Tax=Actinomycetospora chiangmaiensis TaxID=402650 RepID=UPI0003695CF6|nr:alpha/beta fold hydrolase [Actinomycetospora chiangmaiensis]